MSWEFASKASENINSATGAAVSTSGFIGAVGWIFGALKTAAYQVYSWTAGISWGKSETNVAKAGEIQTDMLLTNTQGQRVAQLAQADVVDWEDVAVRAESGKTRSDNAYKKATGSGGGWFDWLTGGDEDTQPANQVAANNPPAVAPASMGAGTNGSMAAGQGGNTLLASLAANVQGPSGVSGGSPATVPSSPQATSTPKPPAATGVGSYTL